MVPSSSEEAWFFPKTRNDSLMSSDGVVMDFIEHSFELLSCAIEDTPSQFLCRRRGNENLSQVEQSSAPPLMADRDYASMHDSFLEALLQEQTRRKPPLMRSDSLSPPPIFECCSDSITSLESVQAAPKKRRPLRLQRRHTFASSRHKRQVHIAEMSTSQHHRSEDEDSSYEYAPKSLRLEDLTGQHPPPHTFVDRNCRMQKDRGKGELPGIDVCAKGREACLEKLRQKMELLAQASLGNSSGNAGMKRRKARIVDVTSQYVETRSVIQLRMGFLAMQYGVLLLWDVDSHMISFVLLRKMCSESFYNNALGSESVLEPASMPTPPGSSASVLRNVVVGNHAILQREDGCEVALMEPPYLVDRPMAFPPSVLRVNVTNVDGLRSLSTWIVKIRLGNVCQTSRLGWNQQDGASLPRNITKLEWQVPQSAIDLQMEVTVFEQRRHDKRRQRLQTTITIPTSFLDPDSNEVLVPVDDASSITLAIHLQSEYANWLQREVHARKQQEEEEEEAQGFLWTPSFIFSPKQVESAIATTYMNPSYLCCAW